MQFWKDENSNKRRLILSKSLEFKFSLNDSLRLLFLRVQDKINRVTVKFWNMSKFENRTKVLSTKRNFNQRWLRLIDLYQRESFKFRFPSSHESRFVVSERDINCRMTAQFWDILKERKFQLARIKTNRMFTDRQNVSLHSVKSGNTGSLYVEGFFSFSRQATHSTTCNRISPDVRHFRFSEDQQATFCPGVTYAMTAASTTTTTTTTTTGAKRVRFYIGESQWTTSA